VFANYVTADADHTPIQTAVIKEALRFSHGVVSPLPRVAQVESLIGGHLVPAGVGLSYIFLKICTRLTYLIL